MQFRIRGVRPAAKIVAIGGLVCLMAGQASAISIRHDRPVASYNALAAQHPAAGYIAHTVFGQFCSGTLVAPNKVLTAAHCVEGSNPATLSFGTTANVPGTHIPNVGSISLHPNWISSGRQPRFDLAVLTLSTPITNVTPDRFFDGDATGLLGTMVGYGRQGNGLSFPNNLPGATDKLAAQNIIDIFGNDLRTDFDHPNGTTNSFGSPFPVDLEGTSAAGDSGGPLYAHFPFGTYIVGVLHGGFNPFGQDSRYGDVSIWANMHSAQNVAFLASHGIHPIPEPSMVALFGFLGLVGLAAGRRRRPAARLGSR